MRTVHEFEVNADEYRERAKNAKTAAEKAEASREHRELMDKVNLKYKCKVDFLDTYIVLPCWISECGPTISGFATYTFSM